MSLQGVMAGIQAGMRVTIISALLFRRFLLRWVMRTGKPEPLTRERSSDIKALKGHDMMRLFDSIQRTEPIDQTKDSTTE